MFSVCSHCNAAARSYSYSNNQPYNCKGDCQPPPSQCFLNKVLLHYFPLAKVSLYSCTATKVSKGLKAVSVILCTGKSSESRARHFFGRFFELPGCECDAGHYHLCPHRLLCEKIHAGWQHRSDPLHIQRCVTKGMDRGASLNKLLSSQITPLETSTPAVPRASAGPWMQQIPQQQSRDWSPKEGSGYSVGKRGTEQEHSHLGHQHLVQDSPVLYLVQHLSLCACVEEPTPSSHPLGGVGSVTQTDSWTPSA